MSMATEMAPARRARPRNQQQRWRQKLVDLQDFSWCTNMFSPRKLFLCSPTGTKNSFPIAPWLTITESRVSRSLSSIWYLSGPAWEHTGHQLQARIEQEPFLLMCEYLMLGMLWSDLHFCPGFYQSPHLCQANLKLTRYCCFGCPARNRS